MAAGNWIVYNSAKEYMMDGTMDLDGDTFKVALATSSYTPALTHTQYSDFSANEVANGNGYTTGGVTVTQTWTANGGDATQMIFDSDDPTWTASGGSIVARYAILYDDTVVSPADALVAYCLLDTTPADVTATDGNSLTIQIASGGYFNLDGADS